MPTDWSSFGAVDEPKSSVSWDDFEPVESTFTPPPRPGQPPMPDGISDVGGGLPQRLSSEEWDRLTQRAKLGEERAGLWAEREIIGGAEKALDLAQEGLLPPSVAEKLVTVGAPALPTGVRKSVGEAVSGLTSPVNIGLAVAGGGASALPKIGSAVARGIAGGFAADIATHMPELGTAAGEAVGTGTPEEAQKALTDVGLSALMGGLAGGGALSRLAPIPPRIVEVIERTAQDLPKSAAAVTKAVTRERPIEKGMTDAETIRSDPGQVRETGRQPEVVQDQGRENIQQPAPEQPQPARAQSGAEAPLLLAERVAAMTPDEFVQAARSEFQEGGFTTHALNMGREMATPEGIAALRKLEAQAKAEADAAMVAENFDALGALTSQKQFFSEALETATGASEFKKSDPAKFRQMMEAPLPEPAAQKVKSGVEPDAASQALRAGVAKSTIPENVIGSSAKPGDKIDVRWERWIGDGTVESVAANGDMTVRVASDGGRRGKFSRVGKTVVVPAGVGKRLATLIEPESTSPAGARSQPFFERESEAAGLGRSSLPPTVETVRQQRATEAQQRAADAAAESGFVPDTRGETVKMRKSAEQATESPMIPEPVQERIVEAPESRYTQQSMKRVEDEVTALSDAELSAMPADSNLYVASKLEQADRRFRAGDNDAGYNIFVELEKQGTAFGQNINQFKRLAGTRPEYVATVIDKKLTAAGKDPLTPTQRAEAIETTRKSKEADLALDKATDAWQAKPTAENAAKAEAALDVANAEALELQKFVNKFQPRSTSSVLKSVLQGNLLTPISEVANLFGNMSFLPFRMTERGVASGLDMIDAAVRNKPRELAVQPLAGTIEALKGAGRGLKKIPDILIEGTGSVIQGETRAGLHPVQAWMNQFARNPEMPTTGGKLTLKDRLNLAIEGTFGVPAEAMLRGLGAGDAPFRESARARVTAEQLKLNNVPRDQWAFAQKFPELFLSKKALEQIHKDTMRAIFQGESKTLNTLTNWIKGKGEVFDFAVATVAPYKLTPWNIVSEILSYNPLIAMARGVYDAKAGNTRAAKLNAGKMVVGSMLTGAGIWLYKNGLIAPSLDQRDESQKERMLSGKVLPANHINISGLTRAMEGGDPAFRPGDDTRDVFRAGGLAGAMFYMTANIGREMEKGPETTDADMWKSILRQSTLEQARFGLNQSFLSGIEGLLTAVKDGNGDNFLRQWANTVLSIPLPNTLNTISRANREYQVDVKADEFKDKIKNIVKTKLGFAGLDDYLPLKRDFWGKPMLETPEGRDAIFYHFFDITKNKQVTSDPVELELYRLWRKTGDSSVIPSLPTRNITLGKTGYALDPKQYERYAELVGENRRTIADALAVNPNFHKLDDEQKIKVLERAYRDGMERGKALFYREFQSALTPKAQRAGFQ